MGNTFQNINKVVQSAVSVARNFIESDVYEHKSVNFGDDELDQYLSFTFENFGYGETWRGLFDETVILCINTYVEAEGEKEE